MCICDVHVKLLKYTCSLLLACWFYIVYFSNKHVYALLCVSFLCLPEAKRARTLHVTPEKPPKGYAPAVCVCVCVCVCLHTCMRACMYVCIHACVCACSQVHIYICVCVYTYIMCTHICNCLVCRCAFKCMQAHV